MKQKPAPAPTPWYHFAAMPASFSPPPTRLHEMNRLEDMGRFPTVIYVGATANVLASILLFYWLHRRSGGSLAAGFGGAVVLVAVNLLPVVMLRWREGAAGLADTPPVEQMGFVRDQHRFPSWVYAVAERQPVLLAPAGLDSF